MASVLSRRSCGGGCCLITSAILRRTGFFFSSRRRHTRFDCDWSSDVCSSDLRYFSPPPIEYSLLASFIGHNAVDPDQRVGNVRAYRQNYMEAGWSQEVHPREIGRASCRERV